MSNSDPMATFKGQSRNEQLFLGGALLAFIFTFLPFEGVSFEGHSASESAWHGVAVLACLLVLVALVASAVSVFAKSSVPDLPVSLNLVATGAMALAVLFFIIRWLTLPSYFTISEKLFWGGYILLIITIATTVIGVMKMRDAGESMPWENRGGGSSTPPAPPSEPPAPPAV